MRQRNHWAVHNDTLAFWRAVVPIAASRPLELLNWTNAIIVLADEAGVAQFRHETGSAWPLQEVLSYIADRFRDESIVDAFGFSDNHMRTRSRLAYYERDGIVETMVDDVGALLAQLREPIDEDRDYAVEPCAPLCVSGFAVSFEPSSKRPLSAYRLPSTSVEFSFGADIWLPWVPGRLDPDDKETFYDNRELAHLHSVRLNKFLAEVRRITVERGGEWQYRNYSGASWLDYLAGSDGIKLIDEPLPRSMSPFDPRSWHRG